MLSILRSGNVSLGYSLIYRRFITSQSRMSQTVSQLVDVKQNEDEYWDSPQYPKIVDNTFEARKEAQAIDWQQEIKNAPTVEEKLIKINMPKYYGYKVVDMNESKLFYNCLPAIQHYTRTLLEEMEAEEDKAKKNEKIDSFVELIKGKVVDALELSHDYLKNNYYTDSVEMEPDQQERLLSQTIVEQINRVLINYLRQDFPHLNDIEFDFKPRHEAFWSVGGINPPKNIVKSKEGREWQKDIAHKPVDRFMQYKSQPLMALRHRQQVEPWKTEAEYNNIEQAKKVPVFRYDPRTLGFSTSYKHGTNIPGHWPGNVAGFGFISYQPRPNIHFNHPEGQMESNQAHAIQSSFAWLLALANYNGFNTYSELTYPMNTQTIVTDGKHWSFYEYQLNTLLMNGHHFEKNPRVNYCRSTKEQKLYQEVDDQGKIVGFNENVLSNLIRFYTNVPTVQITAEELAPFLDKELKYIANYKDEEKRTFLEKVFKHMCSNRPRHLEIPEIYLWEKIYKIDNKTRSMEPRRRFFELFINPWKRTMDQHDKEYIPKAVRPEGPKSKKKFKNTYYP